MQALFNSSSSNSTNKMLFVAGTVALAALTAGAYATLGFGSSNSTNTNGESELLPALTEEESIKIMSDVADKFKMAYMQMMQYANGIKQQYQQQGMQIDENELMGALLPQVEKSFQEAEDAVYSVS